MLAKVNNVVPRQVDGCYVYSAKLVCDGDTCTTVNVQNLARRSIAIKLLVSVSRSENDRYGKLSDPITRTLKSLGTLELTTQDIVALLPAGTDFQDGFLTIIAPCNSLQVATIYEAVQRPQRIFWYMAPDFNNFFGALNPVSPQPVLTNAYATEIDSVNILTSAPTGFDVLVVDDVGADFDLKTFNGSTIVTFDSSISPFLFWFTGLFRYDEFWNYGSALNLNWVHPVAPQEVGAVGDAITFSTLDGQELDGTLFKRRADLLEAYSTTRDNDDIIAYQIFNGNRVRNWIQIGPHFGNYPDRPFLGFTAERLSQLVKYALDVVYGHCPIFPQVPRLPGAARIVVAQRGTASRVGALPEGGLNRSAL